LEGTKEGTRQFLIRNRKSMERLKERKVELMSSLANEVRDGRRTPVYPQWLGLNNEEEVVSTPESD
jgi:hypothetical protein